MEETNVTMTTEEMQGKQLAIDFTEKILYNFANSNLLDSINIITTIK